MAFVRAGGRRLHSMGGIGWTDYDLYALELATGKIMRWTKQRYFSLGDLAFEKGAILFGASTLGGPVEGAMYRRSLGVDDKPVSFGPPRDPQSNINAWIVSPSLSRDLTKMTFLSDRTEPFAYDVYLADANAAHPRALQITRLSRLNGNPEFTADGRSVLFLAGTDSNFGGRPIYSLYQVDMNGKLTKIADSGLFTNPESWHSR